MIVRRDEYKAWRDPDKQHTHHGFFWIKGKPGTGKSTLMKCAHHRELKKFSEDVIISFFFKVRGAQLHRSTEGMYRSLLCQLLERSHYREVTTLQTRAATKAGMAY
jgi:hypothetical protein